MNQRNRYGYIDEGGFKTGDEWMDWLFPVCVGLIVIFTLGAILFSCSEKDVVYAEDVYTTEQIANAIYVAEGGAKTKHPYGILAHYKNTTARQACINTIKHAQKDFNGQGDFIVFLGSRYCPVGASNDPRGLNKNWVRNVKVILARSV
jgi:hypothetical protein